MEEKTIFEPDITRSCPAVSVGLELLRHNIPTERITEIVAEVRRVSDELAAEERSDRLAHLDHIIQRRRKEGISAASGNNLNTFQFEGTAQRAVSVNT